MDLKDPQAQSPELPAHSVDFASDGRAGPAGAQLMMWASQVKVDRHSVVLTDLNPIYLVSCKLDGRARKYLYVFSPPS